MDNIYTKTFLGNEYIELLNEVNEKYPIISIKDFVESYFDSKESTSVKQIEPNRWFFQSYDFELRKPASNEIVAVQKTNYEGLGYQIKGKYYQKPIVLIGDSTEILVKNILSRKILPVETRLVNKWQDMYNIPVSQLPKIVWDDAIITEVPVSGTVYTLHTKNKTISVNNILL